MCLLYRVVGLGMRGRQSHGEIYIVKMLKGWFTLVIEPGRARTHDGAMNWVAVVAANNKKI